MISEISGKTSDFTRKIVVVEYLGLISLTFICTKKEVMNDC